MSEMIKTIATKDDISGLFDSLRFDMRKNRREIFRWMVFFAVTRTMALLLILFLVINK